LTLALTWLDQLTDGQIAAVVGVLAAASAADGVEPISEAAVLRLHHPGAGFVHLLTDDMGTLTGYGSLDERVERRTAEFTVHPAYRRRGVGGALLAALLDRVDGPLWLWAHGEHPAALRLARRALPAGVALRAFVPGEDEAAVVAVNDRAFSWHPEQRRWDTGELVVREAQPWFDPKGLLLAVDPAGRLLGFHWTKVHPNGLGEIYVLAVDPDAQGTGLGATLTVAGLAYLRERGVRQAMLYVESDNTAALRTYHKLGFTHHHTDVEFLRS
jgi:mycothiol synthase